MPKDNNGTIWIGYFGGSVQYYIRRAYVYVQYYNHILGFVQTLLIHSPFGTTEIIILCRVIL